MCEEALSKQKENTSNIDLKDMRNYLSSKRKGKWPAYMKPSCSMRLYVYSMYETIMSDEKLPCTKDGSMKNTSKVRYNQFYYITSS